ncbi:ABC transporter ATP-binding protein [Anaeromicropila populeti]|uniref:ATP-binding cassette, subfamily B n=1 Tax=Anaeromicropila populeti TaxID=37658 RepID=A0A1I6JYD3_9FIRM|nr:ABC transporter ATP-binding protein [Anaeromicropila populeti]SFR83540.1 ATP-binding cassette, subfamily B [Anaeromicropila populeti]
MKAREVMKKNKKFYLSIGFNVIEGILSGCNFMILYRTMQALWEDSMNVKKLVTLTGILLLVFLVRLVIFTTGYTQGQIGGAGVSKNIRIFLGDKMKNISLSRFSQSQTGEYINVATADVNNYETILTHRAGDIVKNITLVTMVIVFISVIFWNVGLVLLIGSLLLIPTLWLSFRSVKKYGNKKNQILSDNVSNITEYITGIQTFRAYGIGGTKNKTVIKSMYAYSDISYVYEKMVIPIGTGYSILEWLCLPLAIMIGGSGWLTGNLNVVDFLMVSIIPVFSCKLNSTIFVDLTSYKNLMISKFHVTQVIDEKEEEKNERPFSPASHDIEFDHVSFAYQENEPVLKEVSFKAENQKLTALIGDSGSGKSTILNLLSKYYEPIAGDIKIGGVSTKGIHAEKVLEHISMVDQEVFLFNDTIKNNIRYARPSAADTEIIEACRLANCDGFISKMEKGYDTPVGENGNQLSGGERQRISIARAILKDSPVLLLDEATASLDIENELAVKEAIRNLLKAKKTVIMIAHTLSIVQKANQILVLSNGKIVEQGNHEELLCKKGKYSLMWSAEEKIAI